MKFKIGDRVRYVGECVSFLKGKTGTVKYIADELNRVSYSVEFDETDRLLHTCAGHTKPDTGWWCEKNDLELIEPEEKSFTVVIQSKGDCTTAKMLHGKKVIREAEVNRYRSDVYNEQTAIEAVVAKMFPLKAKPEPNIATDTKHKIQLLVCVNVGKSSFAGIVSLRNGYVYSVIDGVIKRGGRIIYTGYTTVESLNAATGCEFVEIYNSEGIR